METRVADDAPLSGGCRVGLEQALAFTSGRPIQEVVPIIYEVAIELEIDPAFAIAEAILETGWGRSDLARNKHNWYGYQAYYDDASRARSFATDEQGVRAALETMAEHYFSPDGRFYAGGRGATLAGWAEKWVDGGPSNWRNAVHQIARIMQRLMQTPAQPADQ